jgi:hypothetical protein
LNLLEINTIYMRDPLVSFSCSYSYKTRRNNMINIKPFDRHNDLPEEYVSILQEVWHPLDWAMYLYNPSYEEVTTDLMHGAGRVWKQALYHTLVPFTSKAFKKELEAGRVCVWAPEGKANFFGWVNCLPEDYPKPYVVQTPEQAIEAAQELQQVHPGKKLPGLLFSMGKRSKALREAMEVLGGGYTLSDIHGDSLGETEVTHEDFEWLVRSLGGKTAGKSSYTLRVSKWLEVKLQWLGKEGVWSYEEDGTVQKKTRRFYTINGAPADCHKALTCGLAYFINASGEQDYKGRRAFLPSLFQDEISVGYSHPLLNEMVPNKMGALSLGLRGLIPALVMAKDGNLIPGAEAYEALGYSVFMHKGGKYIVIDAEHMGFARIDGKTFVAWKADKHVKYTGRMLSGVPTAAEYKTDTPSVKYEQVASLISNF